jgi:hypothetical protein
LSSAEERGIQIFASVVAFVLLYYFAGWLKLYVVDFVHWLG